MHISLKSPVTTSLKNGHFISSLLSKMNLGKMAVMTPIVMNIAQVIFGKNINEIAPNLYKKIINKCKI